MRALALLLPIVLAATAAAAPSPATLARLVSDLESADTRVAEQAAGRLAALGPDARGAIPALAALLRKETPPPAPGESPPPPPGEDVRSPGDRAAAMLAALGPEGRKALEEALDSGNIAAAYHAAGGLASMGTAAEPALPAIVRAMDLDLSGELRRLHWHPWMGLIGPLRARLLAVLEGLGPRALAAVPKLLTVLEEGPATMPGYVFGARNLVRTLLAIDPLGDEVVEGVLEALRRGALRPSLDEDTVLRAWLQGRGARAVPALAGMVVREGRTAEGRAAAALLVRADRPDLEIVRRLLELHEDLRADLLDAIAVAGPVPDEVLPFAIEGFLRAEAGDETLARVLSRASPAAATMLRDRMAGLRWEDARWSALRQEAPRLADRLTAAWLRRHASPDPGVAGEDGWFRTGLRGGEGGGAFEDAGPAGSLLVGLRVTTGTLETDSVVRSILPVYLREGERLEGRESGRRGGEIREIVAPEGYAVAGLLVRTGSRLQGFAVVFMRVREGALDPDDASVSRWVGAIESREPALIGGDGRAVVGIRGRAGADIDAIGLVLGAGR